MEIECTAEPVSGSVKVELCSVQQVVRQVVKYQATAWLSLLRESRDS